jgi:hypothetical protein
MNVIIRIGLLLALIVSASARAAIDIVYSGNIDGELEPCGCAVEGNLGGILRHATIVDRLRQEHPDLFVVSAGGLVASAVSQDRLTSEYILKGFAQLGYDAVGVQWSDLAYGEAFTRQSPIPWVASNWLGDGFEHEKIIVKGKTKIAFFSWLDPAQSPHLAMKAKERVVDENRNVLTKLLRQVQKQGMLTVLTTSMTLSEAKARLPLRYVDVLIIRAAYEVYGEPKKTGKTLVLQPGSRGMRLGHVTLERGRDGRIKSWRNEAIPMPPAVPDAARMADWYAAYTAQLKSDYEARTAMLKARQSDGSPYVGAEACQSCHAENYAIWQQAKHSRAFSKLEGVNKAFDPNCIGCHSVGFNKEGGFIDLEATESLANVQCENCHGAARAHVEAVGRKKTANAGWPPRQMCAQCHDHKHSPNFDFDRYWPKIRHGAAKQNLLDKP